jgi:pyruvate dehydrogenase E2 component (dihydrolipoamide acetyltransferase)
MDNGSYEVTQDGKKILKCIPFTGVKRAMARNLEASWNAVVPVSGFSKVDCSAVKALKKRLADEGKKVTYTDIFVKLLASAVEQNPMVNSAIVEKKIELYKSVNMGVAVAAPNGDLLVPVIRDVQEKSLFEVSAALLDVAERVRTQNITEEDFIGGTITISSMGMYDAYGFTQVLVQPQAIIFGFGAIHDEPWVLEDGRLGVRPIIHISSTCDHRIIQGVSGSEASITLGKMFANPEKHLGI